MFLLGCRRALFSAQWRICDLFRHQHGKVPHVAGMVVGPADPPNRNLPGGGDDQLIIEQTAVHLTGEQSCGRFSGAARVPNAVYSYGKMGRCPGGSAGSAGSDRC